MTHPTPEQVAAAVERLTRFYVIGKLEQAAVHGLPMGLGDSSIVVMQALAQAQAELKAAQAAVRRMGRALGRAERDNPQFVGYLPEDDEP